MTINIFIILLVAFASISILLTEAIKKFFENRKTNTSANLIALIDAFVVGGAGSICAYILLGIPFTLANNIAIIAMVFCIWIGSMIGYDKVIQLVKQILKAGESS